jgi:hypothetical protein
MPDELARSSPVGGAVETPPEGAKADASSRGTVEEQSRNSRGTVEEQSRNSRGTVEEQSRNSRGTVEGLSRAGLGYLSRLEPSGGLREDDTKPECRRPKAERKLKAELPPQPLPARVTSGALRRHCHHAPFLLATFPQKSKTAWVGKDPVWPSPGNQNVVWKPCSKGCCCCCY